MVVKDIKLRIAGDRDAGDIARMVNLAFGPERFFADGDRTNPDKIRNLLQKGKFLLAEEAGGLIGCVYLELRGERAYFGLLAVGPERQKSGLGSYLISVAENEARAAGCRMMDLTIVNLRKELPAYYQRRGYAESGTMPFPADQKSKLPCHLIKMSKAL